MSAPHKLLHWIRCIPFEVTSYSSPAIEIIGRPHGELKIFVSLCGINGEFEIAIPNFSEKQKMLFHLIEPKFDQVGEYSIYF